MGKLICIGGGEIPRIKNGIELPYETKKIEKTISIPKGVETGMATQAAGEGSDS